jgi:hypothetical protein
MPLSKIICFDTGVFTDARRIQEQEKLPLRRRPRAVLLGQRTPKKAEELTAGFFAVGSDHSGTRNGLSKKASCPG